jgi:hypothetical protein
MLPPLTRLNPGNPSNPQSKAPGEQELSESCELTCNRGTQVAT